MTQGSGLNKKMHRYPVSRTGILQLVFLDLFKVRKIFFDLFKGSKVTTFNYDFFKFGKITIFNYDLFKVVIVV